MNFRNWSRVLLSAVIFAGMLICGYGIRANAAAAPFAASINIVFDDGRVMFYKGTQAGIAIGDEYSLAQGGETIAKIEIVEADLMYSIGKVTTFTREIQEGGKYDFSPSAAGEEQGAATNPMKPSGMKTGTEGAPAQPSAEEKQPEVKEVAKTSTRRKKAASEEEQAAPATTATETPAPQAEQPHRAKKSGEQPAATEEKPSVTKGQAKKEKEKQKQANEKAAEEEKGMPGLSSTLVGDAGAGLSGMILIPTTQILATNHARLSYNYASLSGSDVVNFEGITANVDSKLRPSTISFGYGLSKNAEIAISEAKDSVSLDINGAGSQPMSFKTTAFSAKYRFSNALGVGEKNGKGGVDLAVIASMAHDKDRDANSDTKYILYGLAAGVQVAENAKVNLLFADDKSSETGVSSHSEKMWGAGVDYLASDDFKVLAEFLKESKYATYKSLGLQYQYDKSFSLNAAYQIYSEDLTDTATVTLKGYEFGANYMF